MLSEHLDRAFGTVGRGPARVTLVARRHDAVAEYRPVALVVLAEQAGGEVIAAAVPLAAGGIDVHLHGGFTHIPIMTTAPSRAVPPEAGQGAAGSATRARNSGSPVTVSLTSSR
jgi:hypothetical protein